MKIVAIVKWPEDNFFIIIKLYPVQHFPLDNSSTAHNFHYRSNFPYNIIRMTWLHIRHLKRH